ncbi:protein STICHEL-like 2 [Durio zibethinus]|uniref:DNA-directed DNA polymerase n=1 Tax=Durio zibethinus TaxID=66656 RepID=A0A6P5Y9G7_DURZI|nr:protein STICHEL-like 2 [Durio zibethinus]
MDGRRHSVDIPITRTLIALRRVRSLRDPSTNSMSKFSSFFDNVKWETNSSNGISLQFVNGCPEVGSDHNELRGPEGLGFDGRRKEQGYDFGLHSVPENSNSKLITCENVEQVGNMTASPVRDKLVSELGDFKDYGLNMEEVHRNRPLGERYYSNFKENGMKMTCMTSSCNSVEDVDSCNGPIVGSSPMERVNHCAPKQKSQSRNQVKLYETNGDVASRVGSPCPSIDVVSNRNTSLYVDEDVDIADSNHRGCGISYCWSKTPRLRESNPSTDFEDLPLLSGDTGETTLCGQSFWKCINGEINPYSDTPRSLSQKFRPKSFDELVGQNVVVRSLLSAISKGRVTSFYLFHGPRGTGKTSASRIFAAALNCLSLEEHKPCGRCRECILFFSGRSRDVKEVDSLRINRMDRLRSLVKNAVVPPVSSRFKIFVIDECQLLNVETWATVLNSLEKLSQHIVFVMTTPELDMLPRSAVSRSQKYHFPKIKDSDISNRLETICVEEGLDYDQVALDFIAAKSNGSLRDAEMMLDQLSLLGKKITMSLTYELIGTVSDDELLDLLDLALSCDTSNTVIRARELMRSKIDPMQLISQLANLIMDILAGKCEEGSSEARRKFSRKHTSEVDLQKLTHALRTLSETEKHLRMSKNQTTWLTVALLQLSSMESNFLETNDSKLCSANTQHKEGDSKSTSSTGERSNHPFTCICNGNNSSKSGKQDDSERRLESTWKRATELCQSSSLKKFLRKQGKLSSLCVNQGMAIAELEFGHPRHVSRAEKSWKHIASSLQLIVGCNVEIRINPSVTDPVSKCVKLRKPSFSLFSCLRRLHLKSRSSTRSGSDTEVSQYASEKPMISEGPILTYYTDHGFEIPHNCSHGREVVRAFRNSDGNILSTGATPSCGSLRDDTSLTLAYGVDSSKREGRDCECQILSGQEQPDYKPNCFPRALRPQKKVHLSESAKMISASNLEENKLALSIPGMSSFEKPLCSNDSYVFYCSDNEDILRENSTVRCWRTPTFSLNKAWQLTRQHRRTHLVDWLLPCSTAK